MAVQTLKYESNLNETEIMLLFIPSLNNISANSILKIQESIFKQHKGLIDIIDDKNRIDIRLMKNYMEYIEKLEYYKNYRLIDNTIFNGKELLYGNEEFVIISVIPLKEEEILLLKKLNSKIYINLLTNRNIYLPNCFNIDRSILIYVPNILHKIQIKDIVKEKILNITNMIIFLRKMSLEDTLYIIIKKIFLLPELEKCPLQLNFLQTFVIIYTYIKYDNILPTQIENSSINFYFPIYLINNNLDYPILIYGNCDENKLFVYQLDSNYLKIKYQESFSIMCNTFDFNSICIKSNIYKDIEFMQFLFKYIYINKLKFKQYYDKVKCFISNNIFWLLKEYCNVIITDIYKIVCLNVKFDLLLSNVFIDLFFEKLFSCTLIKDNIYPILFTYIEVLPIIYKDILSLKYKEFVKIYCTEKSILYSERTKNKNYFHYNPLFYIDTIYNKYSYDNLSKILFNIWLYSNNIGYVILPYTVDNSMEIDGNTEILLHSCICLVVEENIFNNIELATFKKQYINYMNTNYNYNLNDNDVKKLSYDNNSLYIFLQYWLKYKCPNLDNIIENIQNHMFILINYGIIDIIDSRVINIQYCISKLYLENNRQCKYKNNILALSDILNNLEKHNN